MRHRNQRGKLERPTGHRNALIRNQVTSLLAFERIETTDAKAKVLRRVADKMITLGKRGTLHARRQALSVIRDRDVTEKVFDRLAARYAERAGGYTRVLKSRLRVGDAAPLSIVELVDAEPVGGEARKDEKGEKAARGKAAKGEARGAKPARAEKPARSEKARAAKPERAAKVAKPKAAKPKGAKAPAKGGAGRRTTTTRKPSGDR
ncbi:MAG TPA: 50S ribosomal protein L17 [Myxococcota bacterium]|nr:50S ribosomal protein L17 [Myxococcota bacterium]